MIRTYRVLMSLAVSLLFSGCILVPFLQAFKETGATPADRRALLEPETKKFSDAMLMGRKMRALSLVLPESRDEISQQIKDIGEGERVVEAKVDDIQWDPDAWKATVFIKIKYYKVPYYIVESRMDEQHWEFSMSDGWKLRDMTVAEG
jgi:hypothetical protein